jgi:hypothetical protein
MGQKKDLGMAHAARMMRLYGGRPRGQRKKETAPPDKRFPQSYSKLRGAEGAPHPNDVRALPDSWQNTPRAEVQSRKPITSMDDQLVAARVAERRTRTAHHEAIKTKLKTKRSKLRKPVSVSMGYDEEQALRKHARSLNMSFSEWVRIILFSAAGLPPDSD